MFQTVGSSLARLMGRCMGLPLFVEPLLGSSLSTGKEYNEKVEGDEVEDLHRLLARVKREMPEVEVLSHSSFGALAC